MFSSSCFLRIQVTVLKQYRPWHKNVELGGSCPNDEIVNAAPRAARSYQLLQVNGDAAGVVVVDGNGLVKTSRIN